jgi:hypothetical protein
VRAFTSRRRRPSNPGQLSLSAFGVACLDAPKTCARSTLRLTHQCCSSGHQSSKDIGRVKTLGRVRTGPIVTALPPLLRRSTEQEPVLVLSHRQSLAECKDRSWQSHREESNMVLEARRGGESISHDPIVETPVTMGRSRGR